MEVNCDFRYDGGFPTIDDVRRLGIKTVRVVSLPAQEYWAERYLMEGCRVIAVYTGESDTGRYVMDNCSGVQIGNEPFMDGGATWPSGDADMMVAIWLRVRDIVWAKHGGWFPLIAPGMWVQDYARWNGVANRLEGVTAGAVHVYPEASGHTMERCDTLLQRYKAIRPELPLLCTEWHGRWPKVLDYARVIGKYCSARLFYTWNDPGQPHLALAGSPEQGILAWAG